MRKIPEILEGDWYKVETSHGTWWVSDENIGSIVEDIMEFEDSVEGIPQSYVLQHGFGARLFTQEHNNNWTVFPTEEEAVCFLCEVHNLAACPECGELVEANEHCPECGASLENAA